MRGNPYESDRFLNEYLAFHYGKPAQLCPFDFVPAELLRFHERLRAECVLKPSRAQTVRALDIGCAVGRFTLELGGIADQVLGIDNSQRFIEAARRIARTGEARFQVIESGGKLATFRVPFPKKNQKSKVGFKVGDALNLMLFCDAPFQIVAAINLLCRLPAPARFLEKLSAIVAPGGQLILASPYSWLEEYTPPREWLTASQVEKILRPHFRAVRRRDLPFVIREHRRKYQLVVSEVTTFVRKG